MKKIAAVLTLLMLITMIGGCGSSADSNPTTENSVATTEPTTTEVPETTEPTTESTPKDYLSYCGGYTGQGYLELTKKSDNILTVSYSESSEGAFHIAYIDENIYVSDIVDDTIKFLFEDSWLNTGEMQLTFHDDNSIECTIKIVEYDEGAAYGVSEGTFTYIRDDGSPDSEDSEGDAWEDTYQNEDLEDEYEDDYDSSTIMDETQFYFDDIEFVLPVSMDRIVQDLYEHEKNCFYVDHVKQAFDIAEIKPIRGGYAGKYKQDEYKIELYACFTWGELKYGRKVNMTYTYHDIGGWVYYSSGLRSIDFLGLTEYAPYGLLGWKTGNFSYYDYPAGMPISKGEIADDLLYANFNVFLIDGQWRIFDITSIDIIKGDYHSGEFGDYLTVKAKVCYTNSLYDISVTLDLRYRNYDAGGWEIENDYIEEDYDARDRAEPFTFSCTPK